MFALISNRFNRLDLIILGIVALIGLINLPRPFMGDQALATIMAQKMSQGALIYRDLWDLKQPGIFCFYLVGGMLFGFNEIGIHMFELLYMVALSIVLISALKGYFEVRPLASLVPLFTVGVYYGVSGVSHQTQPEALVGFPMFLSLWYAFESTQPGGNQRLRLFFSGLMGGIVLLFKFAFLPILASFWLSALIYLVIRGKEQSLAILFQIGFYIILGVLPMLLILFAYFAWNDMLNLVVWTFFEYPARAMADVPWRLGTLIDGLKWFLQSFSPLVALGFIGAYTSLSKRKDLITLNLALWTIVGFGVILFQRISWWQYHYLLLFVPLGILGAQGLDVLWPHVKRAIPSIGPWKVHTVAILSLIFLFSSTLASLGIRSLIFTQNKFTLKKDDRLTYQTTLNKGYQTVLSEVAFLSKPEINSGNIYVFGSPLYYLLSRRGPAIPLLATWFTPLPELWMQLLDLLDEAQPCYIFVDKNKLYAARNYTPKVAPYVDKTIPQIERKYNILRRSENGVWYALRHQLP